MFWLVVALVIVLIAALYAVRTRGGGRWAFLPWTSRSRNDLAAEEYMAELELDRRTETERPRDLAP